MLEVDYSRFSTRKWQSLTVSQEESRLLSLGLVQFFVIDHKVEVWRGLGTGFIVGGRTGAAFVLTAAHVLADAPDFVTDLEPAPWFGNLESPMERLQRRLQPLVSNRTIQCMADFGDGPAMCPIVYADIVPNPRKGDTAVVMIRIGAEARVRARFAIDVDEIPRRRACIAVGSPFYAVPQESNLESGKLYITGSDICARAGFLTASPVPSGSLASETISLAMPIPSGWSGGPLLAVRPIRSTVLQLPPNLGADLVAVGILSHDSTPPSQVDNEDCVGPSFAVPMLTVYRHSIPDENGTLVSFPDAVARGWIATSGDGARRVYVEGDSHDRPGTRRIFIR